MYILLTIRKYPKFGWKKISDPDGPPDTPIDGSAVHSRN